MTLRRLGNVGFASALLFVCLPVFVLACLAVWLDTSKAPVVRLRRTTQEGRVIELYRLRTETDGAINPTGALLRQLYIDQIPQLLNVLRGELSLFAANEGAVSTKKMLALREP